MVYIAPWKTFLILATCLIGIIFAVPTFLSEEALDSMPGWFPRERINLGLDLQGGSHLLLEVDLKSAFKDQLGFVVEDVRKTLRREKLGYLNLRVKGDAVVFTLRNPSEASRVLSVLKKMDRRLEITQGEGAEISLKFKEEAIQEAQKNILSQSIEIVNRRINEIGTREPNIQRQGDDRIIVQLPGLKDPSRVKRLLGETAKMTFRLLHPEHYSASSLQGSTPAGAQILPNDEKRKNVASGGPDAFVVLKRILLSGEHLIDARVNINNQTNAPEVAFTLSTQGGRKFAEITQKNVGRHLAIVLDGKVISAPRINGPIPGGSGVITGQFSVQEANDLALLMRAGALPAPLTVIEERTVGPDLGADSIEAGKSATIYALLLVLGFMVLIYLLFGLFANLALIFNLILLVAALSVTGSTLTLPGIAGIALTMGMAVDANVLIFERIREEIRLGRKIISAIDAGYKRAMATILDSNITTLIGAGALYFFGSGPIKGFGVTLAFGIVISMFTAISLTRLLVVGWLKATKPKTLPI